MTYSKKKDNRIISSVFNDDLLRKLDWKVLLFSALINILFQLKDNVSSVFGYIGVVAMVLSLFIVDKRNHIYLFMAVVGGNRLFSFLGIPFLNLFTGVYFFENYIFFGSFGKKKLNTKMLIPFIALLVFTLYPLICEGTMRKSMIFVKVYLTFVILYDSIEECETAQQFKDKVLLIGIYFSVGMAISCLIPLLLFSQSNNMARFSMSEKSGENPLGVLLGVGTAFDTVLIFQNRSKTVNILLFILILPMMYIGLLTQSRSFVFILLMILAWLFIFGVFSKSTRKSAITASLIIAVIAVLFWKFGEGIGLHRVIEACIDRIVNPKGDDITNGRTEIWQIYMDSFIHNQRIMFFGSAGTSSAINKMAHNMFIEVIYGYGIVGTLLILWFYGSFIACLYRKFKELGCGRVNVFGMLPLLMMIAGGLGSHSFLGTQPIVEMFFGLCTMFCSELKIINGNRKKRSINRYTYHYQKGDSI